MAGEIVVGFDGQEGSDAALRTAVGIAAAFARPIVLVFGYQPTSMGGDTGDLGRAVREIGEGVTAKGVAAAHAIDPSVSVQVELVNDRPAEALLRAGDEHDALAIVVGSAGPSRAGSSVRSPTRWCTGRPVRWSWFPCPKRCNRAVATEWSSTRGSCVG